MNVSKLLPIAFCLALGACAAPTAPSVVAVAPESVTDKNFAHDDAMCRARAQEVTDRESAEGALANLQNHYNHIYAGCMQDKGYNIESRGPRYYGGPGPYYGPGYYGPGPGYGYGPGFYYGGGWGYGRRW